MRCSEYVYKRVTDLGKQLWPYHTPCAHDPCVYLVYTTQHLHVTFLKTN